MKQLFKYFSENHIEIWSQVLEHFQLTLLSISIASIIGICIGALISSKRNLANLFLSFINILQTIPSLALLGFLIPLIGIGTFPAVLALFIYALLPIVRNTYTGISEIDSSIIEAGKGLGMTNFQLLIKLELPLAIPLILAGIRTASVINVGVATLCSLIAAGGLGESIFGGISLNNTQMILAGAIPASLMALCFDGMFGLMQKISGKHIKLSITLFGLLVFINLIGFIPKRPDSRLVAGFNSEFINREDGFVGLDTLYDLPVEIKELEIGLLYRALDSKKVDFIDGFSTDGKIEAYDLTLLEDDKNYFPPYFAAPIIKTETLRKFPQIERAFNKISGKINNVQMAQMNFEVDQNKVSPADVAIDFLTSLQIKTKKIEGASNPQIIIGSKNFTESYILAHIFGQLIEAETGLKVGLKTGFGGTKLLFDALDNGEVHIYPEYTGTGFLVILKPEKTLVKELLRDKKRLNNYLFNEFRKKYGITWLDQLGFNNTFAIMMRKEQAERLNIKSISDLSNYLKN